MFNWLKNLAEEHEHVDITVASIIFQLILIIEERSLDHGAVSTNSVHQTSVFQDICIEFCAILGKADKVDISVFLKIFILNF